MKRLGCAIIPFVLLFAFLFSFGCAALKLDGKLDESVWKSASPQVVLSSGDISNCGAEFATVCTEVDEQNNIIYLGFKVMHSPRVGETGSPGVAISVDGSEFVSFTSADCAGCDTDEINFEGTVFEMSSTCCSAELLVGVKYGLPALNTIKVRFIDADGEYSNVYSFSVSVEQTTALQTTANITQRITAQPKMTSPKTTSPKTTAEKTVAAKVTTEKTKTTVRKKAGKAVKATTAKTSQTSFLPTNAQVENNSTVPAETTTQNTRLLKVKRGLTAAGVAALIVTAFGVCVFTNMSHDKKENHADK